jgi:STE24 endopeptidase
VARRHHLPLRTPTHGSRPRPDAAVWFSADELATSAAYHGALARVRVLRGVASLAVPLAFVVLGVAERLVRPYPPAFWVDRTLVVVVALEAVALPLRLALDLAERRVHHLHGGPAAGPVPPVAAVVARGVGVAAVRLVLGGLALLVALAVVRATPWWPLVLWAAATVALVAVVGLYPVLVAPLVDRVTPLGNPVVAAHIATVAARAGVPDAVVLVAVGESAAGEGAYVAGLGPTRRLVLSATVLDGGPVDTDPVVAHEAAHWSLHHHRRSCAATATVLASLVALSWLVGRVGAGLVGLAGGSEGTADPRLLPLVALALVAGAGLGSLVLAAQSRAHERQADAVARAVVGDAAQLVGHLHRVLVRAEVDLAPTPWRELWASHPPPAERLVAAATGAGR